MYKLGKELKVRNILVEQDKVSYASDEIHLPEGGIDCNEGCNPYGFPPDYKKLSFFVILRYKHTTGVFA